jgi:hypothetical protein
MTDNTQTDARVTVADKALLPRAVRRTVLAGVGTLLAVSLYLLIVRGPAILFDLARGAAAYCF